MSDALTLAEVDRIARLARLALDDNERQQYAVQLSRILDYARQVSELDTTGIEPTASFLDEVAGERADEVRPSLGLDSVVSNAPRHRDGLFGVPRVLGGE
jgi:aspartyl-tRNA(Asn)/glutamyl-tRNA(Gln) amidotransferase subunit C